jgi:hypothetical protein
MGVLDVFSWHITWGSFFLYHLVISVVMYALGYESSRWRKR